MWTISTAVISFFIFCFIGYVCECTFCSIPKKHFINRGFMYGPYLPIYGSGAMVILYLLEPFFDRPYLVFIFGVISTSAIEYVTSWALEKIFHVKLWDYSTYPLNLNGRVCARNSTLFGIMALFLVYVINDPLMEKLNLIPDNTAQIMSLVIVGVMSADFALSVVKLSAFRKAVEELEELKVQTQERVKELKSQLSAEAFHTYAERLNAEYEQRKAKNYGNMKHFLRSNPSLNASSESLRAALEHARESVNERSRKIKEERRAKKAERRGK